MTALLGPWQPLPGAGGATVEVAGEYTMAAQLGSVTVWDGPRQVAEVTAPTRAPGRPRVVAQMGRVYWGCGYVDLATGQLTPLTGLAHANAGRLAPRASGNHPGNPRRSTRVAAYAWSPDASVVAVSVQHDGANASASLRAADGELLTTFWQGQDIAPRAVWVGRSLTVVSTRQPGVYDRSGGLVASLQAATPAVRIEASRAESRLLVVEHSRLRLWDARDWALLGSASGQWLDASLAPDGRRIVAVDFAGTLHVFDGTLTPMTALAAPGAALRGAQGVAVGEARIAVAVLGQLSTAPLG